MASRPPVLSRKPSTPWDRLRPVKQDPLEAMGYVSKGDRRLLDPKNQEEFYDTIVERYMQFCSDHAGNLDMAFASLTTSNTDKSASSDPTQNPPVIAFPAGHRPSQSALATVANPPQGKLSTPASTPEVELSRILMALRKLREGVLGTSRQVVSPVFSQRVHIFNIRLAILAFHPPSYHPSLTYLLNVLHTERYPLPRSELAEMTGYLILDLALRQCDLIGAYALRHKAKIKYKYSSWVIDSVLKAVTTSNWIAFWRIRRTVDGYLRALLHWQIETVRKTTLKAFGRAYLKIDVKHLLHCVSGSEMSWESLVERENVGWMRDGDLITIRKPRIK